MDVDVRGVRPRDDARGIASVHGAAWRAAYHGLLPDAVLGELSVDPDDADVRTWADRLRANEAGIFVAVEGGSVRGFADFRWDVADRKDFVGTDEAELKAIYVDPDHWGRGVGTALLEAGLDSLPDEVDTLRLAVLAGNDAGKRFYESRGFERTGASEHELAGEAYQTDVYALDVR